MKLKIKIIAMVLMVGIITICCGCLSVLAESRYVDTQSGLRIRSECNTNCEILDVMKDGTEVEFIRTIGYGSEVWAEIEYGKIHGYCMNKYLSKKVNETEDNQRESLGIWLTTAYTHTGFSCANGNYPTAGYTVACNGLPFGTKIYIDGIGERVVEDRGPSDLGGEWIDIFMDSYNECVQYGAQYREVYLCGD